MHVYVDMTEIFVQRTVVFIDDMGIWVSKWILSGEIVPYDM